LTFSTVLVRNSELIKFAEEMELVAVEDYHLWMTLICNGYQFVLIQDSLISYRINLNSQFRVISTFSNLKMIIASLKVIIKWRPTFKLRKLIFSVVSNLMKYTIKSVMLNLKSK